MGTRWRQVLGVFVAVAVISAGFVVLVLTQREAATPAAAPRTSYGAAYVEARPLSPSMGPASSMHPTIATPRPRPTLTVDSGCRIGAGPAELAEVPEKTTRRVNQAWQRIEAWLAAHAPATAATLRPPATSEQIVKAQREVGVALPAELIASLLRHDGTDHPPTGFTLPPFYAPVSAADLASDAAMMCEVLISLGDDSSVGAWWHGRFVPFAIDGSGNSLFLDQREGHGRLGEHDNEGDVMFDRWPATLTELVEQTADALEGTRPQVGRYRPVVSGGELDWEFVR